MVSSGIKGDILETKAPALWKDIAYGFGEQEKWHIANIRSVFYHQESLLFPVVP